LNLKMMKKNLISKLIIIPFTLMLSGCVYLVVGGIGALGGYVVSPDTVEGLTEHDATLVWDTAYEIVSIMGLIEEEHEEGGIMIASVGGVKVTVTIMELNATTTKMTVKARRAMLPKIATAQEVFVKIMSNLD